MKPTNSSLWKSIAKFGSNIDKYNIWSVGDGKGVNTWNDVQIAPNVGIVDLKIVIPMHMHNARVNDIAHENVGQNWEDLNNWLPMNMLQQIVANVPPFFDADPDVRIGLEHDGKQSSVGTMYKFLDDR